MPSALDTRAVAVSKTVKTLSSKFIKTEGDQWLSGTGMEGKLTVKGHKETFWGEENVLDMMMIDP